MARRRSMTYGVMPTREEFDEACREHDPDDPPQACVENLGFPFHNDPRVGDVTLTPDELWEELQKALADYNRPEDDGSNEGASSCFIADAGDWCSSVLGVLGFEWI